MGQLIIDNMRLQREVVRLEMELHHLQSVKNFPNSFSPPPASPPPSSKDDQKPYVYVDTGDVKEDYVNEIKSIFTGEMLSPSEILLST